MIPFAKPLSIAAFGISSLVSGLHFGSHAWVEGVEPYFKTQYAKSEYAFKALVASTTGLSFKIQSDPKPLAEIINTSVQGTGIAPLLVEALIDIESSGNPEAVSNRGAAGLMQVMPFWVGKCPSIKHYPELFDAEKNIQCGVFALSLGLKNQRSLHRGLIEYNGGANCFQKPDCLLQADKYAQNVIAVALSKIAGYH